MNRAPRKGYIAPWSSRRETVGLMGTFVIFFLSYSGHADLLVMQTRHLVQQLIQLTLVLLGVVTPVVSMHAAQFHQAIARIHSTPVAETFTLAPMVKPPVMREMTSVPMNSFHRQMTYLFEGAATLHGQACPNATVMVRLINGDESITQRVLTEQDGTYHLKAAIDANAGDPVDWYLEAYTPDFKKVEISGRKIVQRPEEQEIHQPLSPVIVHAPVEFLVSLSK